MSTANSKTSKTNRNRSVCYGSGDLVWLRQYFFDLLL